MIKKAAGMAAILLAILVIAIGIAKADTRKVGEAKLDVHNFDAKQLEKVDKGDHLKVADEKLFAKDVKLSSDVKGVKLSGDVKLASALELKEKGLAPLVKKSVKLHTHDVKLSKTTSVKADKVASVKLYKAGLVKLGDDHGLLLLKA